MLGKVVAVNRVQAAERELFICRLFKAVKHSTMREVKKGYY